MFVLRVRTGCASELHKHAPDQNEIVTIQNNYYLRTLHNRAIPRQLAAVEVGERDLLQSTRAQPA